MCRARGCADQFRPADFLQVFEHSDCQKTEKFTI